MKLVIQQIIITKITSFIWNSLCAALALYTNSTVLKTLKVSFYLFCTRAFERLVLGILLQFPSTFPWKNRPQKRWRWEPATKKKMRNEGGNQHNGLLLHQKDSYRKNTVIRNWSLLCPPLLYYVSDGNNNIRLVAFYDGPHQMFLLPDYFY